MSLYLTVALIFAVLILPGHLALIAVAGRRTSVGLSEGLLASALFGLLLTAALAHGLGAIGAFSPTRLFIGFGAACAVLGAIAGARRAALLPYSMRRSDLLLGAWLAVLAIIYLPPIDFVFGSSDEGIYLNTAAQLLREGSLWLTDDFPQALQRQLRDVRSDAFLPGYYFANAEQSAVVPHGFHYYPALLAAFWSIGGFAGATAGPCILTLLSIAALFVLTTRIAGRTVGLLVAVVTGVNPMSVWFSQMTFAENMCGALFIGGSALLLVGWTTPRERSEPRLRALCLLVAGSAFGAAHLVKIEYLLVPPIVMLFTLVAYALGQLDRTRAVFPVAYGAVASVAAWFAPTTHGVYFYAQVRDLLTAFGDSPTNKEGEITQAEYLTGLGIAGSLVLLALTLYLLRGPATRIVTRLRARTHRLRTVRTVVAVVSVLTVATLLVFDFDAGFSARGFARYLTVPGLLAGVAGVFYVARGRLALPLFPILLLAISQTLFVSALMHSNIDSGLHPHFISYRRYAVISMPILMLAAIVPWFVAARSSQRGVALQVTGAALALFIGVSGILASMPHIQETPWTEARQTVRWLSERAPENAVWLTPEADLIATRYLVPLRFLEGQPGFLASKHIDTSRELEALIRSLRASGRQPIVVFQEGFTGWEEACRRAFDGREGVTSYIVEHALKGHADRLPDDRERFDWTIALRLHGATLESPDERAAKH